MHNRLRSLLTALGIIFGVGAVIAMLAIGAGAQQEILEQIKMVGVNNIVLESKFDPKGMSTEGEGASGTSSSGSSNNSSSGTKNAKQKFSPGLTLADLQSLREIAPDKIANISPEIKLEVQAVGAAGARTATLMGIEPVYFDLIAYQLDKGKMFSMHQLQTGAQVCILGAGMAKKLFPRSEPLNAQVKCGKNWLTVIGIMEQRSLAGTGSTSNHNDFIYMPIKTALLRYRNRGQVTEASLKSGGDEDEENKNKVPESYHQLDRAVIQVAESRFLEPLAEVSQRLIQRRHNKVKDVEITIPELLLKQQQRTKDIFNIVLGSIAGISLLVGGIGIMNIMLASVLERIKEIGLRIALGAKKQDIIMQFLVESTLISLGGGILGIVLGSSLALLISHLADIPTIITPISIAVSFGVAAAVGLLFGIAPARQAARQDPIVSLRYE